MSYQVLARKWRPQTFSELVGQQHVVDAITNALDNNKLHHAYLFTGTRGVGKTTIARIFSKSLNCEEGQSANPCGKCGTCLDISEGRFVDLLEIDAASRTKVEDTRELLDNVQYKPTRGKYKVYLIDEVHMLSKHSFNALLKTLEEPPPHVKFLLATTDPQKLPVTILSRCLQFSLKSLSREQIQSQLAHILTAESLDYEVPALSQIARAAAGSMRDALSLTDQAIAQGNNQVSLDTVISMLGLLDKNQILRLAKCICERDAQGAMQQLDEICAESPDYSQVLSQLLALLHQVALTQIVPDICKLDTNVAKPIYTLSKAVTEEHIQLLYQIGLNGKRDLPFAPDALTGLQMTIMRMIAFTPAQSIALEVSSVPDDKPQKTPVEKLQEEPREDSQENSAQQDAHAVVESEPESAIDESEDGREMPHEHSTETQEPNVLKATEEEAQVEEVLHEHAEEALQDLSEDYQQAPIAPQNDSPQVEQAHNTEPEHVISQEHKAEQHPNAEHHPNAEQSSDDDDESASNLQALFDMEDDLASYEQQASGDDDSVKKPEAENHGADLNASVSSLGSHNQELDASDISTGQSDATSQAHVEQVHPREAIDINTEQSENPNQDESAEHHSDVIEPSVTEETASSSLTVSPDIKPEASSQETSQVEPSNTEEPIQSNASDGASIQAYLESGEKLISASQIDKWSHFVDSLDVRGLARQLLIHGRSGGIKDQVLLLEINESHHHLNEISSINTIKQALADKYNRDIDLKVQYAQVSNSPYELQQKIDRMRLDFAKSTIESDTAFQELLKAFDAKVVEDSIEAR
jgi:DNA polymerase-3 subunit gamma/tau